MQYIDVVTICNSNLTIAGTNIFPMVTEIKYENEEYEVINLNSAETVLANGSASFPEVCMRIRI